MSEGYGRRLGKFVGLEEPPTIAMRALQYAELTATRLRWQKIRSGIPTRLECADGYLLCLQRRHLPSCPYWIDGRATTLSPVGQGQFLLLNLNEEHASVNHSAVDCISIYISRMALSRFGEEHDLKPIGSLKTPRATALEDNVVRNLSECFLPAFDGPNASQFFIDHVSLALLSHLTTNYTSHSTGQVDLRGRLSPWQERRAKEMLLANMNGGIGLDELARACGLSRSHFARAFKAGTGMPPLQWLQKQRVERAQELLPNLSLTLDQIAYQCGFSDQSHFTRAFSKAVGVTPGLWRRMRRL